MLAVVLAFLHRNKVDKCDERGSKLAVGMGETCGEAWRTIFISQYIQYKSTKGQGLAAWLWLFKCPARQKAVVGHYLWPSWAQPFRAWLGQAHGLKPGQAQHYVLHNVTENDSVKVNYFNKNSCEFWRPNVLETG